jgi:GR25 family glycosyltransferase involved in LPS biosynthesis
MWEFVDKAVYINLDSRPDRRAHMEEVTQTFGDKVIRFPAIKYTPGIVGCVMSHIAILRRALEEKWGNVLILEDDAQWNNFDEGYAKLKQLASSSFDVILLGGSCIYYDQGTYRLHSGQTTTAYLVNSNYIPTLLSNYEEGLVKLQKEPQFRELYSLDIYWKRLQSRDNWYVIIPCLMYQLPSYSDIENTFVDYRGCMNLGCPIPPLPEKRTPLLPFLNIYK